MATIKPNYCDDCGRTLQTHNSAYCRGCCAKRSGLKHPGAWTPQQCTLLKTLYGTMTIYELMKHFPSKKRHSICNKAYRMKLMRHRQKQKPLTVLQELRMRRQ